MMRRVFSTLGLLVTIGGAAACNNQANVQCEASSNCDLSAGGLCVASAVGGHWCAYPDSGCADGYRFSNQDVGDGVGGQCVAAVSDAGSPPGVPPGANLWLTQLHATSRGSIQAAKILSNNDVVVAGFFSGTMPLGTPPLMSPMVTGFVARLRASDGTPIWVQPVTSTQTADIRYIDADAKDNVFIAGVYSGTANFAGTVYVGAGNGDVFVEKLSGTDGSSMWAHAFGGPSLDGVEGLAVDRFGNVSVAGFFTGTISPGSSSLTGTNSSFIIKYDGSTGAEEWSKALTSSDTQAGIAPAGLTVDGSGNVIVVGSFAGSVDFGGGAQDGSGFLVKYAKENGAYIFERSTQQVSGRVASDEFDNIYLAGSFVNSLALASPPLSALGETDVFVVKYAADGTPQWERGFGNDQGDGLVALRADVNGQLFLLARFQGTVSYGGASFSAANIDGDAIVARLSTQDGTHQGSIHLGSGSAIDSKADVFVGGDFTKTAMFGDKTLTTTATLNDGFALLVAPF